MHLVQSLLTHERSRRNGAGLQAHQRVLHGLIGWDAARTLGLSDIAETWKLQLFDALDVLDQAQEPNAEKQTIRDFLPVLTRKLRYLGDGVLVLPAVAAALRLEENDLLEVQPALLLRTCLALVHEPR